MHKIVFITAHNWDTKRQGGFHKFAEASCLTGMETIFFSFPRPYYGLLMHREQINRAVIKILSKGKRYAVSNESNAGELLNITFPTFRVPDGMGRFLSDRMMNWLLMHSFRSFKRFCKKYFSDADCFVFESCEGVAFIDLLKKLFPNSKMIYRPSDPMVYAGVPERVKEMERNILYKADLTLVVNNEGVEAYKKSVLDFDSKVKYQVLSNGIDIDSYTKEYECPDLLKNKKSVLYVGAWEVEWNLLFKACETNPEFDYIVVCPNFPSKDVQKKVEKYTNLHYVPGIKPFEVPAWITNCNVVMVPYVTDFYKDRPLGITAKYYQAMAAHKPIVAYCDTPKLKDVGIPVTYEYADFIAEVQMAMQKSRCDYKYDLEGREWKEICAKFVSFL